MIHVAESAAGGAVRVGDPLPPAWICPARCREYDEVTSQTSAGTVGRVDCWSVRLAEIRLSSGST